MLPAILVPLLSQGLNLLGNAVLAKGKDWVKEKTGVDLDKASLSQEDYVKLKQFEMDHEEELIRLRQEDDKLGFEIEKAYLEDTQSARNMQVAALNQTDVFAKRFVYYFAIFWGFMACGYIGAITFGHIPEGNIRFADTILGFILGTIMAQIIAFFYGSSKSSQSKDDVIHGVIERSAK
jgi:hypothetical protein